MSTSAAFILGRGSDARFLFGQHSDGYIQNEHGNGVPKDILVSSTPEEFLKETTLHRNSLHREDLNRHDTSNCWKAAKGYSYIYTFFDGHVWITNGRRWYNPFIKVKPPKALPPSEVLRKGEAKGEIVVTCGECGDTKSFTLKSVLRCIVVRQIRDRGNPKDIVKIVFKGFEMTRKQGYLCTKCLSRCAQ